jgi:hypothetical protein
MRPIFVFFHVGSDLATPEMLVRSIRHTNPGAEIIQCSDLITGKINGVDRVHRIDGDANNLMTFRLAGFASLNLDHAAIYLDTDMLVVRGLDPAALLADCRVRLCRRDFGRDSRHSGSQRGVQFPEHHQRPLGEVYPYVACATVTQDADFWKELLAIIDTLDARFHRWYGDQEAMRIWVESQSVASHGVLPETQFACLPEETGYLESASILHFKGFNRKPAMQSFFNSLFVSAEPSAAREDRVEEIKSDEIRYVIMTPPPNPKSAGISYLNALATYLRDLGKNVVQLFTIYPKEQLHIWGAPEIPKQNHWVQPWQGAWVKVEPGALSKVLDARRTIVIHGENQHYKWYEGLNVVRYYLHTIGGLQKKGVPRTGEFKLAWHPMFCAEADYVLRKSMVRADLTAAESLDVIGRTLDLSYVGKAWIHDKAASRLPNTIELKRDWPTNDDEYFYLLSRTRRLFTFDAATSVLDDAIIMGAMPIIMSTEPFSRQEWEANLEPEMSGCYCFFGDDYEAASAVFEDSRRAFIRAALEKNELYFSRLREFCERAERHFNKRQAADSVINDYPAR